MNILHSGCCERSPKTRLSRHSERSEESRKLPLGWLGKFLVALGMTCDGFFSQLLRKNTQNLACPFLSRLLRQGGTRPVKARQCKNDAHEHETLEKTQNHERIQTARRDTFSSFKLRHFHPKA